MSRILSASASSTSSTSTGTTASGVVSARRWPSTSISVPSGSSRAKQRVGVADLGQQAAQCILLRGWDASASCAGSAAGPPRGRVAVL